MESLSDSFTTDKELAFYDKIFIAHQDAEGHIRDDLVSYFTVLHCIVCDGRVLALTVYLRLSSQSMLQSFVVEGSHDGCEAAALAKWHSTVLCC